LLCLHTAGSDTWQYRGLMNDKRVTEHSRVIVFDMPWHGKSSPPIGWQRDKFIGYLLPVLENIRGP
jgi:pimeloyl-ACP methyl ester carboxylesterase